MNHGLDFIKDKENLVLSGRGVTTNINYNIF